MAYEKNKVITLGFTAASDMTATTLQFTFVKFAASAETVLPCTAVTDIPIGVLQNLPAQGERAEVAVLGVTKVRVGATDMALISATSGNIGIDTAGRAVCLGAPGVGALTTQYSLGRVIAVDASDNDGALTTALINCISPARCL